MRSKLYNDTLHTVCMLRTEGCEAEANEVYRAARHRLSGYEAMLLRDELARRSLYSDWKSPRVPARGAA